MPRLAVGATAVLALVATTLPIQAASSTRVRVVYSDNTCTSTPALAILTESSSCARHACEVLAIGEDELHFQSTNCFTSDKDEYLAQVFDGLDYVIFKAYKDTECETLTGTIALLATGDCVPWSLLVNGSMAVTLKSDGSVQVEHFKDAACTADSSRTSTVSSEVLSSHACDAGTKWHYYAAATGNNSRFGNNSVSTPTVGEEALANELATVTCTASSWSKVTAVVGPIASSVVLAVML